MLRPARLLPALLLALPLLAAGCGHREDERPPATPAAAETPRRGGTVITAWPSEPNGVNEYTVPATVPTGELADTVFRRLFEEQPDFDKGPPSFKPALARAWEWSPDHKILTVHLREDAVWSDGVPITAEDVRWTWQAQVDPAVAWDSSFMKNGIRDVEIVDPHTVRYRFDRVYAKQMVDANEGNILPKHAWSQLPFSRWRESADWFKQHAVYSGPFVVTSWTPQQEIVLQRNPRYYERFDGKDLPYLDRVVVRIVPDNGAALLQLLNGEVDYILQVPPNDAPRIKAAPDLRLITFWSNLFVFVAWNNDDPLFKDAGVRRALTLAIDRQALADTILGSYGRVASSPIIASVWAHDPNLKPLPYDPAEARRILESKGWKDSNGDGVLDRNGKPFAFEMTSNAGNQQRADAAVMMQEQLKKVGIQATPRVLEFNTLVDQANNGKIAAIVMGLTLDTGLDLTGSFHSTRIPGNGREGSNFERYRNPEVDRLLEGILAQPDQQSARPLLDQLQQILDRDQPITLLWESQRLAPINKRVHGAKPNYLRSFFRVQDWWVEPR